MRFPPEAFLIGAQKSGTSTLAYLLNQHPKITLSQPKEPHFLTHNWDKGLDWYRSRFEGPSDSILLDASTSYTMAPLTQSEGDSRPKDKFEDVPEKVSRINPDARFIYLMRDPVERTYSGYWHSVRTGREYEVFGAALRNNPLYLDVSDYHGQLSLWLDYFPLESFHFVLFEDLKENPKRIAEECFEFLLGKGVETPEIHLDSAKNRSYNNSPMGRRLNKLFIYYPSLSKMLRATRRAFPKVLRDKAREARVGSEPLPEMSGEEREFLIEHFREKNRRLERETGLSLERWQS